MVIDSGPKEVQAHFASFNLKLLSEAGLKHCVSGYIQ